MDRDVEKCDCYVDSGYIVLNIHALSQREDSVNFKDIGGGVEKSDVGSGYGSMNSHTNLQ